MSETDLYWNEELAEQLESINAEHWVEMDTIDKVSMLYERGRRRV